jgi:hypothetical protein
LYINCVQFVQATEEQYKKEIACSTATGISFKEHHCWRLININKEEQMIQIINARGMQVIRARTTYK